VSIRERRFGATVPKAIEVRAAAMDALVRAGWLEQAYNQDVLSR
jgi:hypothetical protein